MEQIQQLTLAAADQVNDLVFRYGHLGPFDAEREVLQYRVGEILSAWAQDICQLGAIPEDVWTVVIQSDEGELTWRLATAQLHCNAEGA